MGRKRGGKTALEARHPAEESEGLLKLYAQNRDLKIRDRLIAIHQGLVRFLANKFAGRSEPIEDLVQVGTIGLINAIDRFDPSRGTKFPTYATPTIIGVIRRHFRDRTWALKVPRKLQERSLTVIKNSEVLSQELGRSATIQEIAQAIGVSEEKVLEAIKAGKVYDFFSLDSEFVYSEGDLPLSLAEIIGQVDASVADIEKYGDLVTAIARLDKREQLVINLRFFKAMSQTEVARILNVSQTHVSRLQKMAIGHLKELMISMGDV